MTVSAGITAPLEGKTLASTTRPLAVVIDYFVFRMPTSQLRSEERPPNFSRERTAATNVSCTRSSATLGTRTRTSA